MTTRTLTSLALALCLLALAQGCGSVRHLVRHETAAGVRGGIVHLDGPVVQAMPAAHVEMTEACQGRWRLLEGSEAQAMLQTVSAAKAEDGADVAPVALDAERDVAYACLRR